MPAVSAERHITAFLDGEDSPDVLNPIHSTEVATQYGFRGALVGGVTTYGWMAPAILEVLGERWLEDGWADVSFRRPIFPGDELVAHVDASDDGACEVAMVNQDGERCIAGRVGLGKASWLDDLSMPERRDAEERPNALPYLTMANAPLGDDLRPLAVPLSHEDHVAWMWQKQHNDSPFWTGSGARVHPGWLDDIYMPERRAAEERPNALPYLTMANAPLGDDLRPLAVPLSHEDHVAWMWQKQHNDSPFWTGPGARVHPGWLAGRMTPLLHHSYDYSPSIHTRSQVQHLAPAASGQTFVFAGHFTDAFERKGHHYAVIDGVMLGEDGRELARLRHTTIFRVAK